jgi:hypothetical protein
VPLHAPRAGDGATVAAVRARLGDRAFEAAWATGQAMTLEQAVAEALRDAPARPASRRTRRSADGPPAG